MPGTRSRWTRRRHVNPSRNPPTVHRSTKEPGHSPRLFHISVVPGVGTPAERNRSVMLPTDRLFSTLERRQNRESIRRYQNGTPLRAYHAGRRHRGSSLGRAHGFRRIPPLEWPRPICRWHHRTGGSGSPSGPRPRSSPAVGTFDHRGDRSAARVGVRSLRGPPVTSAYGPLLHRGISGRWRCPAAALGSHRDTGSCSLAVSASRDGPLPRVRCGSQHARFRIDSRRHLRAAGEARPGARALPWGALTRARAHRRSRPHGADTRARKNGPAKWPTRSDVMHSRSPLGRADHGYGTSSGLRCFRKNTPSLPLVTTIVPLSKNG